MTDSPAWDSLSLRQQGLYLAFKRRYKEKRAEGVVVSSNAEEIHFSGAEATKPGSNGTAPLYGNERTFYGDVDALIEKGFIKVVSTGYFKRSATLYGFSDRWLKYKSGEQLDIPLHERRLKRPQKGEHMANI